MIKTLNSKSRYMLWIIIAVLFACSIIAARLINVQSYIYDSFYYWTTADPTIASGHFNLLDYPETFRGCLLPLALLFLKQLFRGIWGWRVCSSLMVSLMIAAEIPFVFGKKADSVKDLLRIFAAYAVFLYIWGDFIQYPLSDLPAFFAMLSGVCICKKLVSNSENKPEQKQTIFAGVTRIVLWVVCGILYYIAYNTRAAYLYAIIIEVIYICFRLKNVRKMLCALCGVLIGVLLMSVPQCAVNKKYTGTWSPKVYTEQYSGYSNNLQNLQVYWGLECERYETYAGDPDVFPTPSVNFRDGIGSEILSRNHIAPENFTLIDIAKLVVKYPLDMIGLYARHLIALMTPAWNQTYIYDIAVNRTLLVSFIIIIWIIAAIAFFSEIAERNGRLRNGVLVFILIIPALLQLFGAPEVRFFISVHMLLYVYAFGIADYKGVRRYVHGRWIQVLIAAVFVFVLWITVFGMTLSDNSERVFLINDRYAHMSNVNK